MVDKFVHDVCGVLSVQAPKIQLGIDVETTDTTLAVYIPETDTLCVRPYDKFNKDLCFALAHELRHVWQFRTDRARYLDGYKNSTECSGIEEYNLQPAEIDANAFAALIMIGFFHLAPQWNGLPKNVVAAIERRLNELIKEYA